MCARTVYECACKCVCVQVCVHVCVHDVVRYVPTARNAKYVEYQPIANTALIYSDPSVLVRNYCIVPIM